MMSKVNTSGLKPAGRAILVRPYEPELASSIIALPDSVQDNQRALEQRAVVIEVGPAAWMDEPVHRAKPGDKVLVGKYNGHMAVGTADGEQYRFVNDKDIFALIEVENNVN
jgi:co-chaperonin GroES (HSP10)